MFNNKRDHDAAVIEHQRAWTKELGGHISSGTLSALMKRVDGECAREAPQRITCGVDVEPRSPSLFTQRILWVVSFAPRSDGGLQVVETSRTVLGWDM